MKTNKIITALLTLLSFPAISQQLDWAYSLKDKSVQNAARHIASNGKSFVINASVITDISYDFKDNNASFKGPANVLAKYDSKCNIEWVIEQPGGGSTYRNRILMMDDAGNTYACGRFSGTVDFDPGSATQNVTSAEGAIYIQKLDDKGKLLWVGYVTVDGEPVKIEMKSNGNLIVAGRSQGASSAKLSDNSTVTVEKGVFILEFSPTGAALNAYSIPTPESFNNNIALAIDNEDNIYVGASISGTMNLDLKSGNLPDTSFSGYDVVLAKYDNNFNYVKHRIFGDKPTSGPDGWDVINHLTFSDDGYLYAAGWFTWVTDFDPENNPGLWVKTASTKSQSPDGFVIKYDTALAIQWIQEAGGHTSITTNADINYMDMVIKNGSVLVYGSINGSADFDGSESDFILKTSDNGLGMCIAQYTTSGNFTGAWLLDGNLANEYPNGIEHLEDGIVGYGTFQKKLDADLTGGTYYLQTDSTGPFYNADNDLFLIKFKFGFATQGIRPANNPGQLLIYPNPADNGDEIIIAQIMKGTQLQIMGMDGKVVYKAQADSNENLVVKGLIPGVYFVQAISDGKMVNGKFVVR